jgi:hypothetical protein
MFTFQIYTFFAPSRILMLRLLISRGNAGSSAHSAVLAPLLEEAHAPHSQLEAEEEEVMMGGLCMLIVCVLHALLFC